MRNGTFIGIMPTLIGSIISKEYSVVAGEEVVEELEPKVPDSPAMTAEDIKKRGKTHYSPSTAAFVLQREERERRKANKKRRGK